MRDFLPPLPPSSRLRSGLFGTPTVWRNNDPFVWKVRQTVFRRHCRSWWNVQPNKALLHGMDPFWAGLEESGGIPENAVVCAVALGLDGLDLGAPPVTRRGWRPSPGG